MRKCIRQDILLSAIFCFLSLTAHGVEKHDAFLYLDLSGRIKGQLAERLETHVQHSFYHAGLSRAKLDLSLHQTLGAVKKSVHSLVEQDDVRGILIIGEYNPDEADTPFAELKTREPENGIAVDAAEGVAFLDLGSCELDEADEETAARRIERLVVRSLGLLAGLKPCPLHRCVMYQGFSPETIDHTGRNLCPPDFKKMEALLVTDEEN